MCNYFNPSLRQRLKLSDRVTFDLIFVIKILSAQLLNIVWKPQYIRTIKNISRTYEVQKSTQVYALISSVQIKPLPSSSINMCTGVFQKNIYIFLFLINKVSYKYKYQFIKDFLFDILNLIIKMLNLIYLITSQ